MIGACSFTDTSTCIITFDMVKRLYTLLKLNSSKEIHGKSTLKTSYNAMSLINTLDSGS